MALKRGKPYQMTIAVEAQQGREPGGGTTQQWRTVRTLQGRLVPATAMESTRLQQRDITISHKMIFGQDPQATSANRFRIGGPPGGRVFYYRGGINAMEQGRFWLVYVEEQGFLARNPGT